MALAATVFSGLVGIVLSHCRLSSITCPAMAWVMVTKLFYFHACFTPLVEVNIIESVATQYENPRRLNSLLDIS
jgi:hypothetical protein